METTKQLNQNNLEQKNNVANPDLQVVVLDHVPINSSQQFPSQKVENFLISEILEAQKILRIEVDELKEKNKLLVEKNLIQEETLNVGLTNIKESIALEFSQNLNNKTDFLVMQLQYIDDLRRESDSKLESLSKEYKHLQELMKQNTIHIDGLRQDMDITNKKIPDVDKNYVNLVNKQTESNLLKVIGDLKEQNLNIQKEMAKKISDLKVGLLDNIESSKNSASQQVASLKLEIQNILELQYGTKLQQVFTQITTLQDNGMAYEKRLNDIAKISSIIVANLNILQNDFQNINKKIRDILAQIESLDLQDKNNKIEIDELKTLEAALLVKSQEFSQNLLNNAVFELRTELLNTISNVAVVVENIESKKYDEHMLNIEQTMQEIQNKVTISQEHKREAEEKINALELLSKQNQESILQIKEKAETDAQALKDSPATNLLYFHKMKNRLIKIVEIIKNNRKSNDTVQHNLSQAINQIHSQIEDFLKNNQVIGTTLRDSKLDITSVKQSIDELQSEFREAIRDGKVVYFQKKK